MPAWLSFYEPPFATAANDALWANLRSHATALGLAVPERLERERPWRTIWSDPALAFAQTCGLPLATSLRGQVRRLATPVYDFPGCGAGTYRSHLLVRRDAPFRRLADLAGTHAVINSRDSFSGCVALAGMVAPLATAGRFFAGHHESGAHLESLRAVSEGRADACACDCVTFGLIARHRPAWIAALRVLVQSEPAPAPPYITRGTATDEEVSLWQEALRRGFADPRPAAARALLGLTGLAFPAADTYSRIAGMAMPLEVLGEATDMAMDRKGG